MVPRYRRYHIHFAATRASRLHPLERLFGEVTERCVRRSSHSAVSSLEMAMLACLDERNKDPRPFLWTADADLILGKVQRPCERLSGH